MLRKAFNKIAKKFGNFLNFPEHFAKSEKNKPKMAYSRDTFPRD